VDGTLLDSKEDIVAAVNFTLRSLSSKEKPFEEIVSYIGRGVKALIRKSLGEENRILLDKALGIYENYFNEHSTDKTTLYPNVKEILEYLKEKKLFVLTNRRKKMAEITLQKLGILEYFSDIIGGDEENCLKPSPAPLNKALKYFENKKDASMIVGDMDLDISTGKNAGIITCAVTYGIGKKEDIIKAQPDYIIEDLIELKEIIK
jgi:HAD superfamily hydrolase (TIGR01549 family)